MKKNKSIRKPHRHRERNITHALFVAPATLIYFVFFIIPILWGIYYSFTNYNGISPKYDFVGLHNYITMFTNHRFGRAFWFNIRYSVALVVLTMVLSLCIALLLNRKIRCRNFFRAVYFLPAVLSMLTIGLVFNEILTRVIPAIGLDLGIDWLSKSILSSGDYAIWGVLLVHIWQGIAIPTVLFLAGLQTVPEDLYEAAALDGASAWQKFWKITIPFLIPTLSIVFVLVLKDGLTVFDYIMAMTGGGPAGSTESVAMLIYNHGFGERKFSLAIAESIVLATVLCLISYIQIAWSNRKKVY